MDKYSTLSRVKSLAGGAYDAAKGTAKTAGKTAWNATLKSGKWIRKHPMLAGLGGLGGLGTYALLHYNVGPTATLWDLAGNMTRKDDGTPIFTRTYTYDNFNDAQKAFLQDAVNKKQT